MTKRPNARILVVDDHQEMARMLADQFQELGYSTDLAASGADALAQVERRLPDVVITDLRMDRVDGLDVLEGIRRLDPQVPVILMTAFGAVDGAIEAIRKGAYHYLAKPFPFDELLVHVERALKERQLREEHQALQRLVEEQGGNQLLIGESPPMVALLTTLDRVAPTDAPVLILGESGTGKELVARMIHARSPRRGHRFVPVNCSAVPESLLESELFGHVRGAFTGATGPRRGLFVEADGGTLFLDEIAEMPPGLQAKLLRVIEDGEVRAVGADATRRVDARILAATHGDLEARVAEGLFREDLFYRLNVLQLQIPPLRDRGDDVPRLAAYFLDRARREIPGATLRSLSFDAVELLKGHSWPGNVRELANLMLRLVLLSPNASLDAVALQGPGGLATSWGESTTRIAPSQPKPRGGPGAENVPAEVPAEPLTAEDALAQAFQRAHDALRASAPEELPSLQTLGQGYMSFIIDLCDGNKSRAARILGIDVSTIHRKERQRR